jgi:hypothetical protein
MDYNFDSSDILFPGDDSSMKSSKLTSSMGNKVPEGFDWAGHDFAHTFNDKTAHYLGQFISSNQRTKINNQPHQHGCFGPLHTTETSSDEKMLLFTDDFTLYENEKQKMINGALEMIQNDVKNNHHLFQSRHQEEQTWQEEMYQDYNAIESIGHFSDIKPKLCPINSQRNDVISPKGQPLDKHSGIDYPTQSKNRRQASKVSKIAGYFKTRLEKTMTVFFS